MARRTRSVFAKSNQGKLVGTVVNNMLASSERKAKQAKKDQARASESNERARDREQKQREKARLKTEVKAARDSAKRLRDYAKQRDKEDKIRERIILELENNNIDLIPIMFLDVLADQVEKTGLAINQIASGLIRPRIEKLKAESFEYFLRISLGMKPSQAELNSLISDFQDSPDIDAVFGDSRYQLLYVDYGREVFRNRYFNNVDMYANQAWYSALFDSEQIQELIDSDIDKVPENFGQKPGRLLSKEDWEKNYEQQYEEKHRFNYIPQDFIEFF